MSDLAEFLLARIGEDEAQCRQEIKDGYGGWQHESGWPSHRVLAECESKRRIVEASVRPGDPVGTAMYQHVLWCLTLPYADHPDYRSEWAP